MPKQKTVCSFGTADFRSFLVSPKGTPSTVVVLNLFPDYSYWFVGVKKAVARTTGGATYQGTIHYYDANKTEIGTPQTIPRTGNTMLNIPDGTVYLYVTTQTIVVKTNSDSI